MRLHHYLLPSEQTLHVYAKDAMTGQRLLVTQSAALTSDNAMIFGTMRKPWWDFIAERKTPQEIRDEFLAYFEQTCRAEGIRVLTGNVPLRIWEGSYSKWSGFYEVQREADEDGTLMVLVRKQIG